MLLKIYEMMLKRKIKKVKTTPDHIMIVSDEKFDVKAFKKLVEWCRMFEIKEITLCTKEVPDFGEVGGVRFRIVRNGVKKEFGNGEVTVNVISGFAGKEEIVSAVRELAKKVAEGELSPQDVDERVIEENLTIRSQPDLIIKAGNEIPEFLIWQTIYSELYFADIDWKYLRFVDFLRILREYQRRERRYGK